MPPWISHQGAYQFLILFRLIFTVEPCYKHFLNACSFIQSLSIIQQKPILILWGLYRPGIFLLADATLLNAFPLNHLSHSFPLTIIFLSYRLNFRPPSSCLSHAFLPAFSSPSSPLADSQPFIPKLQYPRSSFDQQPLSPPYSTLVGAWR